jgi:hypothetical protein
MRVKLQLGYISGQKEMITYVKYLNGALSRYIVREITSIVIALETSDRKDEPRRFYFHLHIVLTDRPHVYLQRAC